MSGISGFGETLCRIIGVLLHYSWMTGFIVMTYIAVDILLIFSRCTSWHRRVQSNGKITICWLISAVFVGCCIVVDLCTGANFDYGSDNGLCFIQPAFYRLVLFIIPVFTMVTVNFFCFIISIISIYCSLSNNHNGAPLKERAAIFTKIFSLVGVTWILGILPQFIGIKELWYPFLITNSLQGVSIFFAFGINKKARVAISGIIVSPPSQTNSGQQSG